MPLGGRAVGRIRSRNNARLEKYVRVNKAGYVTYRHPRMDHYESFGKDVAAANEMALAANTHFSNISNRISRVLAGRGPNNLPTFSHVIDRFIKERIPELNWAEWTLAQHTYKLDKMREYGGDETYEYTDVLFFAEMVNALYKRQSRIAAISLLRQIDAFARGNGLRIGPNVCNDILKPVKVPRQRQRIKAYSDYLKIRECAESWLQDAMDLALITLQPRQVLCSMSLGMISGNLLRVWRKKTDTYIEIEIGKSLKSVIARRRIAALRLGTRRLICKAPYRGNVVEVLPKLLTNSFTRAVKASGLYESNLPTLHELRSLGGRMYEERGFDKQVIQNLMGHKDLSTTDVYLNPDEPQYIKSKALLELD